MGPAEATHRLDPLTSRDQGPRRTGIHPDFWYPLARSEQLQRGKAIGVTFAGEPIVLVRTVSGALFAMEDRCAHRQVPLHAGVVEGETLRCCYHGWTYGSEGQCLTVPYLDRARTQRCGVRKYPCREAYGLIFVFPGDAEAAESAVFPQVEEYADPKYKTRRLDRQIACHYSFMHENLMDMSHQFLHRMLTGRVSARLLDVRASGSRLETDYTFIRSGRQPLGERFMVGTGAPAEDSSTNLMTIATCYPYQTLYYWGADRTAPALSLWMAYVPLDRAQRTNRSFGLMMIRRPRVPGLIHLLWPFIIWFTESIFAEDQWIVEEEQKAFDAQNADWNQDNVPAVLQLKELLQRCGTPLQLDDQA